MKRLVVLFVVLVSSVFMGNQANATNANQLKGKWKYKSQEAPYKYSTGQFIINDIDGKTTVTVKFMDDTKLKAENVRCEKTSISFVLNVEYNEIMVSCELKNGKLIGVADSSEGEMDITATKKL